MEVIEGAGADGALLPRLFADEVVYAEVAACFNDILSISLRRLHNSSLADWNDQTGAYRMLRATRAFARERLVEIDPKGERERVFIAHFLMIAQENGGEENQENPIKRALLDRALPHARNAISLACEQGDAGSALGIGSWYIHFIQRQARSAEFIAPCLAVSNACEKQLGEDHFETGILLNNLALLYQTLGRFEEAEPLCGRAVEIFIAGLGAQHPNSVGLIQNHIVLLNEMGILKAELSTLSPAYIPILMKMRRR